MKTEISFTMGCFMILLGVLAIGIPIIMAIRETRLHKKRVEIYAESCGKIFESIALISITAFREISKRKTNKRA